jgi:xanthine dehydrogenase molybdenum-binding subunit
MHFAFSFAAQAAEVEVNTRTGEVKVLRIIAGNDVGKAINPLGLQGQVEGGVVMGIGNCLTENFIVENGYVFTDHLARYRMPSITHTPEITSIVVEHPSAETVQLEAWARSSASRPALPSPDAIFNGWRANSAPAVDQAEVLRQIRKQSMSVEPMRQ